MFLAIASILHHSGRNERVNWVPFCTTLSITRITQLFTQDTSLYTQNLIVVSDSLAIQSAALDARPTALKASAAVQCESQRGERGNAVSESCAVQGMCKDDLCRSKIVGS
jgi:hypothetical protein